MEYIIAGTCILLCIFIIFFGLRVLKESREMSTKKPLADDEAEDLRQFRP